MTFTLSELTKAVSSIILHVSFVLNRIFTTSPEHEAVTCIVYSCMEQIPQANDKKPKELRGSYSEFVVGNALVRNQYNSVNIAINLLAMKVLILLIAFVLISGVYNAHGLNFE